MVPMATTQTARLKRLSPDMLVAGAVLAVAGLGRLTWSATESALTLIAGG